MNPPQLLLSLHLIMNHGRCLRWRELYVCVGSLKCLVRDCFSPIKAQTKQTLFFCLVSFLFLLDYLFFFPVLTLIFFLIPWWKYNSSLPSSRHSAYMLQTNPPIIFCFSSFLNICTPQTQHSVPCANWDNSGFLGCMVRESTQVGIASPLG